MLVGLTASGKTTCYKILEHAMSGLRVKIDIDDKARKEAEDFKK